MIVIRENSLAAYFEVGTNQNLMLLGIFPEDAPAPTVPEAEADAERFDAVEIMTAGGFTRFQRGGKALGFTCPDVPHYVSHESESTSIGNDYIFTLNSAELEIKLHFLFAKDTRVVRTWTEVKNVSDHTVGLEYVSSFAVTGLADNREENVPDGYRLMIPRNGWCREFNWQEKSLSDWGYNYTLCNASSRISASNTGAWSTKEYLPMGCLLNADKKTALLWQIESNSSWSWEISDSRSYLYLRLSGPSHLYNDWYREIIPGETFESVKAAVSYGEDFNGALADMTAYRRMIAHRVECDRSHPVIFNDYMMCLNAKPTTEKLLPQIDAAAAMGCEIFCVDGGWYDTQKGWWTIGDWQESREKFPNGMIEVFDYIRKKGMKPGLWLEPESLGDQSTPGTTFPDECFFMRHGKRVVERGRLNYDMRNPKVIAHLDATVDRLVHDYGIEYFKFDYNIDPGMGTEVNADSLGDGLMQSSLALLDWIDSVQARYPDLIIENCSSGGMRMDYLQLQHYSVQSLTDVWENRQMIGLAAAAPTAVLPEQACVWCLPKTDHKGEDIASVMVNAMFRRIHLSGSTAWLDEKQAGVLREGIRVYKETRHLVDKLTPFYPLGIPDYDSATDTYCVGFRDGEYCYLTLTYTGDRRREIRVPLDFMPHGAEVIYPSKACPVRIGHKSVIASMKNQAIVIKIK